MSLWELSGGMPGALGLMQLEPALLEGGAGLCVCGLCNSCSLPPTPHPCYCSGARMEMLALAPTADHTCLECADTSLGALSICPAVWAPGRTSPGQRSKLRLQPWEGL